MNLNRVFLLGLFMKAGILYSVLFLLLLPLVLPASGAELPFTAAFYYGANPPLNELKAFDVAVVDPDSGIKPSGYGKGPSALFAYVSVGEADPGRAYVKQMDRRWLIGDNAAWKSKVVDVSNPVWRRFFIDKVIEPLWSAGYRGFFLDTLDSYQLAAKKEDLPAMEAGLVSVITEIKNRHPDARLILNRGFEIFDRVKGNVFAVAAESLYQNFNPSNGVYGQVTVNDCDWLIGKLNRIKSAGVPIIAIDYVEPGKRELARATAEKIKGLGFIPWVTDKDLASLGVGAVEVMPRRIIGLYDGSDEDLADSFLQAYGITPLNYLGYTVETYDFNEPLPKGILAGRYAGVVVWPVAGKPVQKAGVRDWLLERINEGVPVAFMDGFGVPLSDSFLKTMGLELQQPAKIAAPFRITTKAVAVGFERQPQPGVDSFLPIKNLTGKSWLTIESANGIKADAVAIMPWGGYAQNAFVLVPYVGRSTAWVIDPFLFFKTALRLPDMPVPDVTTENGVRQLLIHVDGDAFESMAEWPGGRLAAVELREQILKRYRLPTSISLITGVTAANGMYPQKSAEYERESRKIMEIPWVEAASHTFSHPFYWGKVQEGRDAEGYSLKIPGYRFNLKDEIDGSIASVSRLLPKGKRAALLQWSGDCMPGEDALRQAYQAGVYNINGGDTMLSNSYRTLTAVAPLGLYRGEWYQVFAPNQNENVYTNDWTGPYYGYRRVLETFRLTDRPRRLKPVNIYYHFYSATKEASLNALKQVYDWAVKERLFAIYTTEYAQKVLDFNRMVIAKDGDAWLVRNGGTLRELRVPVSLGYPDLTGQSNVAGYSDHEQGRYLHLVSGDESRIRLVANQAVLPYLSMAGGYLDHFKRTRRGLELKLHAHTPFTVRLGGVAGCRLQKGRSVSRGKDGMVIELSEGAHALAINCP
jgi:hypothetical protein